MAPGSGLMRQGLRKILEKGSRYGLSIDDSRIAFACVARRADGSLQLDTSAVDNDTGDQTGAQRLTAALKGVEPARNPVISVLAGSSYQLLLVEVPKVPADEVNSAVRWHIKDLLEFPVDDAVIELFDMPELSTTEQKPMAYAVATQRSNIESHIETLRSAGISSDVIDIPELCIRNLATLLPQDAEGVGFLHFTQDHGILTVTRQGVLYLIRRIEKSRVAISAASEDDFARSEIVSGIVLEIQRSLDYYESHFDRRPLNQLVLAPGSDIGGLGDSLKEQLSLTISGLDLNNVFELQTPASQAEQGDCLVAIGAALRAEPLAA